MSDSTNSSTNSSNSLPDNPEGFKRYIVVANSPPMNEKNKYIVHREITENVTFDDLLKDIEKLHDELNDVIDAGNKIKIHCCSFLSCLSGNKQDIEADHNKVSII